MEILAINGGKPVREKYLTYGRQSISEDDIVAVEEVLKSDYLTTGPKVCDFEKRISEYVESNYAVSVSNGTAGLHLACMAAGISVGDEVIVSSITFAASANAVLYCGGTPIFADIDSRSLNITATTIEKCISDKTKAIIAVDFTGQAVDMDEIRKVADRYNLIVIEDAAHALGSEYKGRKVGTRADMTIFSFHPVKPITTGEGGAITTNSKELYEKLCLLRSHGIEKRPEKLFKNEGPWYHEQLMLGYNYRLTDIQAALGISQMKKLNNFIKRRREISQIYHDSLRDVNEIILPYEESYSKSGYHLYVIQIKENLLNADRKTVYEALQAENIGVNVHYIPVYLHPYYQKLGYKQGTCQNAERYYQNALTIPLYPSMSNNDVEDVVKAIIKVINWYRK